MEDEKYLTHQTSSFQEKAFSSWISLKQKLCSFFDVDSQGQINDSKSNKKQDASIDSVVLALESLLDTKIASPQLRADERLSTTNIDHCQQVESWDCGIACLLMINRWLSPIKNIEYSSEMLPDERRLRKTLIENIDAKSIWTADLVLELHKLLENNPAADYIFCSKNMGVDESYQNIGYYRDNFSRDQGRVTDAFAKLSDECSSSCFSNSHLPLVLAMNAVSHPNCVAIALVDNSKLHGNITSDNNDDGIGYVGHYVIVCGCTNDPNYLAEARKQEDATTQDHEENRCIVLMNPAQDSNPIMYVLPSRFERSWRASGTDDDLVFIIRQ